MVREGVTDLPVLVYDGDCGFCTRCVQVIERYIPVQARLTAWQFTDLAALGVTRERAEREVLWIDPTAAPVRGGAQAVASLLITAGGGWAAMGRLLRIPPVRWIAAGCYRLIAINRHRMPGGTPACALPPDRRPGGTSSPRG